MLLSLFHMERDENATSSLYGMRKYQSMSKERRSIFNTAGDSAFSEFPSAVNVVECSVAFQNDIKKRNGSDKTEIKLEFRIGINMGDVVKKEAIFFADGKHCGTIRGTAQPNGISISKSVYGPRCS